MFVLVAFKMPGTLNGSLKEEGVLIASNQVPQI